MILVVTELRQAAACIRYADKIGIGIVSKPDSAAQRVGDVRQAVVDIVGKADDTTHGVGNGGEIVSRIGQRDKVVVFVHDGSELAL